MIILTGGAGFIGSCVLARLNEKGVTDVLVVDRMTPEKRPNLAGKRYRAYLDKDAFIRKIRDGRIQGNVSAIIHMGACSSTMETDANYLWENNTRYSINLAEWALARNIRLIYASSAATYGGGELGYDDAPSLIPRLEPLNLYAASKQAFDLWALKYGLLKRMLGFKFFNVFGPNEQHKGGMRSVVYKAYEQVRSTGTVTLFASGKKGIADGEQTRDFIYVKDVVEVILRAVKDPEWNGLFNLGSGKARNWNDLARAVFAAMGREPVIRYAPLPPKLRGKYQYHTQATTVRLLRHVKGIHFTSLEDAVKDTVQNHLIPGRRW